MKPVNRQQVNPNPVSTKNAQARAKFNAKTQKYDIYMSKGKGTGFMEKTNFLFRKMDKKRATLRMAIQAFAKQNPCLEEFGRGLCERVSKGEDVFRDVKILQHLPTGISVNAKGAVYGSHVIAGAKEAVKDVYTTSLKFATKEVDGVELCSACIADFDRTNIYIATGKSTYDEVTHKEETTYNESSYMRAEGAAAGARELIELAETPKAAKLLSHLMHQGVQIRLMQEIGTPAPRASGTGFVAASPGQTLHVYTKTPHVAADGTVTSQDSSQIVNSKLKLSKNDKFYKIEVDWPWYASSFGQGDLPDRVTLDNNSLKMHMKYTILIDKDKANKGELAFEFENAPAVDVDGNIQMQPQP